MARDIFTGYVFSSYILSVCARIQKGGIKMKLNFSEKLIWTALKGGLYLAIGLMAVTTARGVKLALSLPDVE